MKGDASQVIQLDYFKLLKEARESWDYFFTDELVYAIKALDGEAERDSRELKAYIDADLQIEICVGLGGDRYAVAIVEAAPTEDSFGAPIADNWMQERRNDGLMFVDAVKFMQPPEMNNLRPIPTVVRLELFDNRMSRFDDISQFRRRSTARVFVIRGRIEDGELRSTVWLPRTDAEHGELPGQVIKARPQIEGEISKDDAP